MKRPLPAIAAGCLCILTVHAADGIRSKSTYAEKYGGTRHTVEVDPARDLPRLPPVEPTGAIATWQVKPGFRLELEAHEPQVRDPVALCFDERGRMFVCEMIDYSEMRETTPHGGRISMLEDRDGDGRYETSRVFADDLPWPTGLLWANGGLYVGATPDIWRFEDRDDDGHAEVREKVFTGFGTGLKVLNVQGLLNSFQWGPDNRIHVLGGGGNRGLIRATQRPDLPPQELGGRDFWFDPLSHSFGFEPGGAQYGMSFDNSGRRFGCSNSDHLQHWVFAAEPENLSPIAGLPPLRRSIAADGGAAPVFRISPDEPWRIIRTRWRIAGTVPGAVEGGGRVSGYFTGATGTTIYRGDAYGPGFLNNSFTGDAGGQLVHRKILRPSADGVSLVGERPPDEAGHEFAASRDTWVRVVNFANGPDGCLHLCDMYREVIEHPWSIPDEIKKHLDLNSGNDRGRIYRLVPESGLPASSPLRRGQLAGLSDHELVDLLGHPNGWHRDTAQRLLYERQDRSLVPALHAKLKSGAPLAQLHCLSVLDGLKSLEPTMLVEAMRNPDPHVRERGVFLVPKLEPGKRDSSLEQSMARLATDAAPRVRFAFALTAWTIGGAHLEQALVDLAARDAGHEWIGPAVLSGPPGEVSRILFSAVTAKRDLAHRLGPLMPRLIEMRAATCPEAERASLLEFLAGSDWNADWIRALGRGFQRAGVTLAAADPAGTLAPVWAEARRRALDTDQPVDARLAALTGLAGAPESAQTLERCLADGQPAQLQQEALRVLFRTGTWKSPAELLNRWKGFGTATRETALELLLGRKDGPWELLLSMERGEIPPGALSPGQVQSLAGHPENRVAQKARTVLAGIIPPSRSEVLAQYTPAASGGGDAARGALQFAGRCAGCHRAGNQGVAVGPDLVTVKNRGREGLLSAILDPNREVAAQYVLFTVETDEGEPLVGFIGEDGPTGVTLRMAGGTERRLERSRIRGMRSGGRSLMPEGLETGMSVADMADLLAFIESIP